MSKSNAQEFCNQVTRVYDAYSSSANADIKEVLDLLKALANFVDKAPNGLTLSQAKAEKVAVLNQFKVLKSIQADKFTSQPENEAIFREFIRLTSVFQATKFYEYHFIPANDWRDTILFRVKAKESYEAFLGTVVTVIEQCHDLSTTVVNSSSDSGVLMSEEFEAMDISPTDIFSNSAMQNLPPASTVSDSTQLDVNDLLSEWEKIWASITLTEFEKKLLDDDLGFTQFIDQYFSGRKKNDDDYNSWVWQNVKNFSTIANEKQKEVFLFEAKKKQEALVREEWSDLWNGVVLTENQQRLLINTKEFLEFQDQYFSGAKRTENDYKLWLTKNVARFSTLPIQLEEQEIFIKWTKKLYTEISKYVIQNPEVSFATHHRKVYKLYDFINNEINKDLSSEQKIKNILFKMHQLFPPSSALVETTGIPHYSEVEGILGVMFYAGSPFCNLESQILTAAATAVEDEHIGSGTFSQLYNSKKLRQKMEVFFDQSQNRPRNANDGLQPSVIKEIRSQLAQAPVEVAQELLEKAQQRRASKDIVERIQYYADLLMNSIKRGIVPVSWLRENSAWDKDLAKSYAAKRSPSDSVFFFHEQEYVQNKRTRKDLKEEMTRAFSNPYRQ